MSEAASEISIITSNGLIEHVDADRTPELEQEAGIRNLIDLLLDSSPLRSELNTSTHDGVTISFTTREAEYKLPNGDRIYLARSRTRSDVDPDQSVIIYDYHYYHPHHYDAEGRLVVQRYYFDFSSDSRDPENMADTFSVGVFEVCPPGLDSTYLTSMRLLSSHPTNADYAVLAGMRRIAFPGGVSGGSHDINGELVEALGDSLIMLETKDLVPPEHGWRGWSGLAS